ncbi:hypothetical protein JQC91_05265 [Jannaschia sp. Os4]|uniref:hypothetical protein n=1 Tax=Jannaschia sp. Os4 TaxID=2807617 RepID=UPI001939CE4C|nr:hypothetical protein [Jannaschia sp. Os4]MBM2575708.1 hypothetical protein [Jannaschia sp. Os4]
MSASILPTSPRARPVAVWIGIAAALAVVAVAAALALTGASARGPLPAPGLAEPVDAAGLTREAHQVLPVILADIYAAFAETEEAAIYDGLSGVAAGAALEALYLEQAGALASGGLPDQVVHEIRLLSGDWGVEDGDAVRADIRWAVLGQVGHDEHTHMRGNAYGADLLIEPSDGAWRLTGFALTDVDRTDAGTLVTEPGGDADGTPSE